MKLNLISLFCLIYALIIQTLGIFFCIYGYILYGLLLYILTGIWALIGLINLFIPLFISIIKHLEEKSK